MVQQQHAHEPTTRPTTSPPEPRRRDRLKTAREHERAAMLAEFNGTYDLAREHREAAERLRRTAGS
jgi:hypothetical protein